MFDYLCSVQGEGKRLLDFGPGDGWPSLIVAPFVGEVVGVDGSERRTSACTENAERLGATNARFVFVPPGMSLPFEDESFDGVMAASSIEQTPEPRATLGELFRVLRPGGRLRTHYESLTDYRNGREQDLALLGIDTEHSRLILFDRDIEGEQVRQYGLTYAMSKRDLANALAADERALSFAMITTRSLETIASDLIDTRVCTTMHPSGETLATWLRDVGFRQVKPTHDGAAAAAMLFDRTPEAERPESLDGVDELVRPVVEIATLLAAPLDTDPMITAIK
jgi:SAM-dependent methyltransferase